MEKKIQYLKNTFSQNDYELIDDDIKDLKIQLKRKPIQIYLLAIKWLIKKELLVTYENVREIIKNDIKIRNNIRDIITSLEESIRVQYLDITIDSYDDFDQFYQKSKSSFHDVLTKINKLDLDDVRKLRNDVNHLVYFLIFNKLDDAINKLKKLRNWRHVNQWVLDKYLDSINELKNRCENLDINYKVNFFKIFAQPFNWSSKNRKISEIDQFKEVNKRSFVNNIFESFYYLNNLYGKISFKKNINIIDFIISSIIFDSLVDKIREIDMKLKSKILEVCDFETIIKNSFRTKEEMNGEKISNHKLDKDFLEKYIGKQNSHETKDNYGLPFLKGIRNKLIHPNGKSYNKTHMYSIGTHEESKSAWFPFGDCELVENEENRSPTFFIKKSIFVESIQKISEVFIKKINMSFNLYIEANAKKNKPSLVLVNIQEVQKLYNKYFEDREAIYLLFIWSVEKEENNILIEYLIMVYTVAKFMKKSNDLIHDWKSWILPDIDKDMDNLMQKCNYNKPINNYLKSKMGEENWEETEWLRFFGQESSNSFLKMYKKVQIKDYKPRNIEEKFLLVIFHNKTQEEWLFLLKELKEKYDKRINEIFIS